MGIQTTNHDQTKPINWCHPYKITPMKLTALITAGGVMRTTAVMETNVGMQQTVAAHFDNIHTLGGQNQTASTRTRFCSYHNECSGTKLCLSNADQGVRAPVTFGEGVCETRDRDSLCERHFGCGLNRLCFGGQCKI